MDNNDYVGNGNAAMAVSLIFGFIAWVGTFNIGDVLKVTSMAVSIVAGIMAIRYYYYATKKQK